MDLQLHMRFGMLLTESLGCACPRISVVGLDEENQSVRNETSEA
jgi:hypothetical protein